MKWFGPTWKAPINRNCKKAPTPTWKCLHCKQPFTKGDRGVAMPFSGGPGSMPAGTVDPSGTKVAYHRECLMKNIRTSSWAATGRRVLTPRRFI